MTSNLMALHRAFLSTCHCVCIATLQNQVMLGRSGICTQKVSMQDCPRFAQSTISTTGGQSQVHCPVQGLHTESCCARLVAC